MSFLKSMTLHTTIISLNYMHIRCMFLNMLLISCIIGEEYFT